MTGGVKPSLALLASIRRGTCGIPQCDIAARLRRKPFLSQLRRQSYGLFLE
jgi:hypothetical protein